MKRARAALCLLAAACGPAEPPRAAGAAPAWPAGTVLAVAGEPVRAQEVEPLAEDIGLLYPEYSPTHRRRLALTNGILARAAGRTSHAEAWAAARERARQARAQPDALEPRAVQGDWRALGLELWSAARRLEPGTWSEPLELTGRWVLVRLEGRALDARRVELLELELCEFPYLDPPTVEQAIAASRLEIVDPTWNATVPEDWKHRMAGGPERGH
jgi:hypothetical protein